MKLRHRGKRYNIQYELRSSGINHAWLLKAVVLEDEDEGAAMRLFKNMNSMRPLKPEEFNRNMKIIEDAFNGTDTWHELALIPAVALWASSSGIWYRRHAVGQLELRIDEFAGNAIHQEFQQLQSLLYLRDINLLLIRYSLLTTPDCR